MHMFICMSMHVNQNMPTPMVYMAILTAIHRSPRLSARMPIDMSTHTSLYIGARLHMCASHVCTHAYPLV